MYTISAPAMWLAEDFPGIKANTDNNKPNAVINFFIF
jgi:hypothetical protein